MAKEAMTSKYWLNLGDDGILRVKIKEDCSVDIDDIQLFYEAYERLTEGKIVPWLLVASTEYSISRDAQEFGASQSHRRLGMAIVTESTWNKLLINTYSRIIRPKSPLLVFTDEAEAIAWLKLFLK